MRFSKGIHPETVRPAAERAAELMRQHAGATLCKGLVDAYPAPLPEQVRWWQAAGLRHVRSRVYSLGVGIVIRAVKPGRLGDA